MAGNCPDCWGKGNRESVTHQRVPCVTCDGSGRLPAYTVAEIAAGTMAPRGGPGLSLSRVQDALLDLLDLGCATQELCAGKPDLWRLT